MANRKLIVEIIGDSSSLQRSFAQSSRATKNFDRDFSRTTRGILAGSGVFQGLGRSIAFASGGFLAFASAGQFIRTSIDAAKEAVVTQAQLAAQFRASGQDLKEFQGQIDQTANRLSVLAGFENDQVKAAFTTIFRVTGNVSKALRDTATAADFARAKHIDLSTAATLLAKVEGGNTTLLRRQGVQVAKNATVEQALASVREKFAGQAQAGTTAQERFGAVLHNTEETIGTALLPTLNKYLASGSRWLEQMNESGKLQKDVSSAAEGFAAAMSGLASAIKTVDRFTGGFKHTLELLAGLKLASWAVGAAQNIGLVGATARTSAERTLLLRGALLKLAGLGVITVGIEILLNKKTIDNKVSGFLDKNGLGFLGGKNKITGINLGNIDQAIADAQKFGNDFTAKALKKYKQILESQDNKAASGLAATRGAGPHGAALLAELINQATADDTKARKGLTVVQKNTFFDNAISRILLRGGLKDISAQISALQKADVLIEQRLKVTKDMTRRLNLEDQLLQNQAQIKDLNAQQAADAVAKKETARQAVQDALQKAADARAKSLAALTSKQFRQLGLSATGDEVTPGVAGLKKRLGQLTANVSASSLNTPKLQSELARFRKVLSEGLVPKDVRAKIKEMMDAIADQLKQSPKQLTKFRHTNANALLSGLGLDAETTRILRQRLAQVGAGGTVPGSRSAAFAGAGANNIVVHTSVNLDGKKVAQNTTSHQRKQNMRRSDSRRGPYAGRH